MALADQRLDRPRVGGIGFHRVGGKGAGLGKKGKTAEEEKQEKQVEEEEEEEAVAEEEEEAAQAPPLTPHWLTGNIDPSMSLSLTMSPRLMRSVKKLFSLLFTCVIRTCS